MDHRSPRPSLERTFDEIEGAILPSVGLLLDCLLDSAASARAGTGSGEQAEQLRILARQVEELSRRVETLTPAQSFERPRMSA